MLPVFRKDSHGRVIMSDTMLAKQVKSEGRKWETPVSFDQLRAEARHKCREAGGDAFQPKQWMGFLQMQWGTFRGETYRWLLENSPGYYGWLVNKMNDEVIQFSDQLFMHKMTFGKYINFFEEGREIVDRKSKKSASTSVTMDSADDRELLTCLESYEGSVEDFF